ncbi:MAG: heme ABC exporter ATP-binding protein CcmA [Pseudomonadota bacterium]
MELRIESITARRGGRTILAGLTASVPGGRALIVTGPNGAGKSTLLRMIAGFLPPVSGRVVLHGDEGPLGGSALQPRLAYAGHLDAVKPALGVAQNLMLWAGLSGTGSAEVDRALAAVSLETMASRPAGECSAGQRRRLGLARLLVSKRPVWMMDEPTASLDRASAEAVSALVETHCEGGGIAVIATHLDMGLRDPLSLEIAPFDPDRPAAPGGDGMSPRPGAEDPFLAGHDDAGAFR